MEIYSSLSSNLISLLLFSSLFIILVRQWGKLKTKNQTQIRLPPGPWRLPLIGSLHHLMGAEVPHRILRNLAKNYGPVMYLQLGQVPTVVISSPSFAKQVLKTHDPVFASRPEYTSTNILLYNNKGITFSPYGDYWRQMCKICIVELLSAKMVKSFSAIRGDELSTLISSIRNSMSGSSTSTMINMSEKVFWCVNSVICRAAFGKVCKDRDEFITILKEVMLLSGGFFVADLFPSWKLLHNISGEKSRMVKAHKKIDALMEDIINGHTKNKAAGNNLGNGRFGDEDLVDVFLRIKDNAELQFPITNDHLKAVLFDIFLAGSESSSTMIIWALSEMMKRPNVMAKAQSEVRQVLKGKKNYDEEDLEKLTYLKLVIKETLRLHPGPFIGSRECREQIDIDGYTIPVKTRILVNAWALGRDPGSWDDPESFIPERFENSSIDFMGNNFEFIPFGAGKRMCPGMLFGLANVAHPLAQLLYHFDWELPYETNPKDLDMTEAHGVTGAKQELYLVATNHKNNDEF
ncbi:premnaspirodiene oxygenase-like [Lycium ferocissimum]|uniref:premnaspirodiene oxygenase-like n=1 Tax=Lycium ferocissimum TaxID=112874 RepID=UPI002814C984|nr:premnaspirodiene oxygenase-like [Lycium ferocissimum]